jgi:hypothetical protein
MNQKIKWYLISRTIHGHYLLFFGSVIKFYVLLINFWSFWFDFMVLNATFNNISVISWQSVLLMEETRGPGENH